MIITTEVVRSRPKYDNSRKEYEVQRKRYIYNKSTRKLREKPNWNHYKYYSTEQAAIDALRDFRRSKYDIWYREYPDPDIAHKYPHIIPIYNINRYRIVKRKFI